MFLTLTLPYSRLVVRVMAKLFNTSFLGERDMFKNRLNRLTRVAESHFLHRTRPNLPRRLHVLTGESRTYLRLLPTPTHRINPTHTRYATLTHYYQLFKKKIALIGIRTCSQMVITWQSVSQLNKINRMCGEMFPPYSFWVVFYNLERGKICHPTCNLSHFITLYHAAFVSHANAKFEIYLEKCDWTEGSWMFQPFCVFEQRFNVRSSSQTQYRTGCITCACSTG